MLKLTKDKVKAERRTKKHKTREKEARKQLAAKGHCLFHDASEGNYLKDTPFPNGNSFVAAAKLVLSNGQHKSMEAAEAAVEEEMTTQQPTVMPHGELRFAGESHYFNVNANVRRENATMKHVVASLVMRYRYLSEQHITQLVMPQRFHDNGAAREQFRKRTLQ